MKRCIDTMEVLDHLLSSNGYGLVFEPCKLQEPLYRVFSGDRYHPFITVDPNCPTDKGEVYILM